MVTRSLASARHALDRAMAQVPSASQMRKSLEKLHDASNAEGGYIVRTAAQGARQEDFEREIKYLHKLHEVLLKRADEAVAPALIFQEADLSVRVVRDIFSADFDRALVDDPKQHQRLTSFFTRTGPELVDHIEVYEGKQSLFEKFGVEDVIEMSNDNEYGLSAAVYTQTTDVEIEVNGLMTYDRERVKMDAGRISAAARKLYEAPPEVRTLDLTLEPGGRISGSVHLETESAGRGYEASPDLKPSPYHHGMADYRRWKEGTLTRSTLAVLAASLLAAASANVGRAQRAPRLASYPTRRAAKPRRPSSERSTGCSPSTAGPSGSSDTTSAAERYRKACSAIPMRAVFARVRVKRSIVGSLICIDSPE